MARYVILRKCSVESMQDAINEYAEKGYDLNQFVVKSKPNRVYVVVMELRNGK